MRSRCWLVWVMWLVTPWVAAAEKVVLYGDDDYPPYSYVEQGQFKGIYVELLRAAAQRMGEPYQIELQPIPWKRGLALLEGGDAFALFPPYLRKERTFIQPYSEPLYREQVVVVCNAQALRKVRSRFPDDFGDVVIGVNTGFALSDTFVHAREVGAIKVEESKGNERNLLKLANNRIGCYANDRLAIRYALGELRRKKDTPRAFATVQLTEVVTLSSEDAYIGYSLMARPGYKADFIARLDAVIQSLKREGVVDRLVSDYGR